MIRPPLSTLALVALLAGDGCHHPSPSIPPSEGAAGGKTPAVVSAATKFLDALDVEKRGKVLFPSPAREKPSAAAFKGGTNGHMTFVGEKYGEAVWSNFPVSDVPRPGLSLGSLNAAQREAAMNLLREVLSARGFQKVLDIMGSDQALANGGTHFSAGTDVYTLGIFGAPSATSRWMIQFGGHHLGLNIAIEGDRGVLAPALTGAQPAVYVVGDRTVRAMAAESDKAFALLDALDEAQRSQATLGYRVPDLVSGPGSDRTIVPEGVKGSALNRQQRGLLLDLIAEWAGIVNDAYASERMAGIEGGLDDTWFAWSGPSTHEPGKNGTAYYRIQGPRLVIEFSPQGVGGDLTMHVHTIYRDPENDYGRSLARN